MRSIFLALFSTLALLACNGLRDLPDPESNADWKTQALPPSAQSGDGDSKKGLEYLIYGDYIGTGIPFSFLEKRLSGQRDTVLNRTGNGGLLSYPFNAFRASNGVEVVAGNCFTCHASMLNGELVLGLGNAGSDFQKSIKLQASLTNTLVKSKYGKRSDEYEAFEEFGFFYKSIAPWIKTPNPGVNPAFRLEEACANYRDPVDLTYKKDANFETIRYTLAANVPPLWNIDKRMPYTTMVWAVAILPNCSCRPLCWVSPTAHTHGKYTKTSSMW
ncbi:MAG: hypothetical protein IPJ40_20450 [Saprospirales bacterium]|nr:hypothetical protein [Saprospirales bacterium]